MKKILISLMVIVVAVAMVGAGTFAHFSDKELTTASFTAGTLDLHPDDEDITSWSKDPINPSVWYKIFEEVLHNAGTKPGELTLHLTNLVEGDGVNTEPEEDADGVGIYDISSITDVIVVYCYAGKDGIPGTDDDNVLHHVLGTATWEEAVDALLATGVPQENIIVADKLDTVICKIITLDSYMKPCEKSTLQILLHVEQALDVNKYQGDTCSFDIVLGLVEVTEPPE